MFSTNENFKNNFLLIHLLIFLYIIELGKKPSNFT
jgi:hypothetical protein